MAQHDYNLSNNTGALYRADNNAALQAIVTQNSGASAPAVTFPGMLWLDLSAGGDGIMRRRNQANSAWLADIGVDQTARDAAAAAATTANAAMPRAGGTFTGVINLPTGEPTNNQAVSRAAADLLYQVRLPATQAGALLVGAASGWTGVLGPAANDTVLVLSGGLPSWHTGATTQQPNSYVRTKSDGTIDASLIPAVATGLRFRGTFKPAVNAEYPTTGGSGAAGAPAVGDFWVIDGLTTGGFTYLTGSLAGVTVYNGDSIAKSDGALWFRMGSVIDVEGYVRVDGSTAMEGDLNLGAHYLTAVGGITARAGTPVPLQNFSIDASNVVVSPQRGNTGADLPIMAAGQLGTDMGRAQIFVGAGATNVGLLPIRFFSSTAAYGFGDYVFQVGQLYRAKGAVAAGAFVPSQWDYVPHIGQVVEKTGDVMTGNLQITKNQDGGTGITINNFGTGPNAAAAIGFSVPGGAPFGYVAVHAPTAAQYPDTMIIGTTINKDVALIQNFQRRITFNTSGQIALDGYTSINAPGGYLNLHDNRSAAGGNGGRVGLYARNNAGNSVEIGAVRSNMTDGATGAESANLQLFAKTGGQMTTPVVTLFPTFAQFSGVVEARDSVNWSRVITSQGWQVAVDSDSNGDFMVWHHPGGGLFNRMFLYANGNLSVSGVVTATNIPPSDRALKKDIVECGPRDLSQLPFYEFAFIDDESGHRYRGPMADDVLAISPQHVVGKPGKQTLHYGGLAIEMVTDCYRKIADLSARLAVLESDTEH